MSKNYALLVTSAQADLLSENGKAWGYTQESVTKNKVVENLSKILSEARKQNISIIHSPVGFDYAAMKDFVPKTAIQSVILQNKLLELNSAGFEFIKEASPVKGETVLLPRQGFSSFWAQSIPKTIKELKIDTIYLAGMLAEGCIESHARDAAENGLTPIVISDAIGSISTDLLDASMKTLALHSSNLLTSEEVIENWNCD